MDATNKNNSNLNFNKDKSGFNTHIIKFILNHYS